MPQLRGNPGIRWGRSEGGVGAAVYSVKASPLALGDLGVTGVVTPLVEGPSDMIDELCILSNVKQRTTMAGEWIRQTRNLGQSDSFLSSGSFFFLRTRDRDRSLMSSTPASSPNGDIIYKLNYEERYERDP